MTDLVPFLAGDVSAVQARPADGVSCLGNAPPFDGIEIDLEALGVAGRLRLGGERIAWIESAGVTLLVYTHNFDLARLRAQPAIARKTIILGDLAGILEGRCLWASPSVAAFRLSATDLVLARLGDGECASARIEIDAAGSAGVQLAGAPRDTHIVSALVALTQAFRLIRHPRVLEAGPGLPARAFTVELPLMRGNRGIARQAFMRLSQALVQLSPASLALDLQGRILT